MICAMEETLESFTKHLTRGTDTALSKFRMVFTWVATNIAYDVDAFTQGLHTPRHVENGCSTLRRRKATCSGYSDLLERMCRSCGIECVKVRGHAKGAGYLPGKQFTPNAPNHEWNAVCLDGRWYLADVCWSAGYLQQTSHTFVFKLTDHYFLSEPEIFVVDHLPTDPTWQLLPVSAQRTLDEFQGSVHFKQGFFQHGLSSVVPESGVLEVAGDGKGVDVTLRFPYPLALTYELRHLETGAEYSKCVSFRMGDSSAEFCIRPAVAGAHTFKLYGKVKGCHEEPVALTTHTLRVSHPPPAAPLPWRDLRFPWGQTRHLAELGLEEEGPSCSCLVPEGGSGVYEVSFTRSEPGVTLRPVLCELADGIPRRCKPERTCHILEEDMREEVGRGRCGRVRVITTPPCRGHYWLSIYGSRLSDPNTPERCVANFLLCSVGDAVPGGVVPRVNARWRHECPMLASSPESDWKHASRDSVSTTELLPPAKKSSSLLAYLDMDLVTVGKLTQAFLHICAKIGYHSHKSCTRFLRYMIE